MTLNQIFEEAVERKASDIHLASGEVPCVRVSGDLVRLELPPLDRESLSDMLVSMLPGDGMIRIESGLPVERTVVYGDLNFTGIFFRTAPDGLAATFRVIGKGVPGLETIGEGAHDLFESLVETPRGLIINAGPTGSGKWTTACSVVDAINARKGARIFVIEAHPGFRFVSKKGLVTQLHVGEDCESYERALETANQADIDVVAVDSIPSAEVLRRIMNHADIGHLVVVNMHADNVGDALKRLEEAAGDDVAAFRRSFAKNLVALTGQRLFSRIERPGRVPAYEYITGTPAIRAAILSGDHSAIAKPQEGCRTLNEALNSLVEKGLITEESASLHRTG